MNYMPDILYFAVTRAAARRVTSLRAELEARAPYGKVDARERSGRLYWGGGGSFASVEVLALPSPRFPRLGLDPAIGPVEHLIELVSGPNHDYRYYPIFHGLELALLQIPGVLRIYSVDEAQALDTMLPRFERIAGRLAELMTSTDYEEIHRVAAEVLSRVSDAFPTISSGLAMLPWTIHTLTGDDEAASSAAAAQLTSTRPPEALPRLRAVALERTRDAGISRVFAVYQAIAGGSPIEAPPDPEALSRTESDDPWERWVSRHAAAAQGHPGPLLAALADPAEAQDLLERASFAVFLERIEGHPEHAQLLDAYVDVTIDEIPGHEALLAAIAALARAQASTWPLAGPLDPTALEGWRRAAPHCGEELRAHVQAIVAALRGDSVAEAE